MHDRNLEQIIGVRSYLMHGRNQRFWCHAWMHVNDWKCEPEQYCQCQPLRQLCTERLQDCLLRLSLIVQENHIPVEACWCKYFSSVRIKLDLVSLGRTGEGLVPLVLAGFYDIQALLAASVKVCGSDQEILFGSILPLIALEQQAV